MESKSQRTTTLKKAKALTHHPSIEQKLRAQDLDTQRNKHTWLLLIIFRWREKILASFMSAWCVSDKQNKNSSWELSLLSIISYEKLQMNNKNLNTSFCSDDIKLYSLSSNTFSFINDLLLYRRAWLWSLKESCSDKEKRTVIDMSQIRERRER